MEEWTLWPKLSKSGPEPERGATVECWAGGGRVSGDGSLDPSLKPS